MVSRRWRDAEDECGLTGACEGEGERKGDDPVVSLPDEETPVYLEKVQRRVSWIRYGGVLTTRVSPVQNIRARRTERE